jgi:hypothetical protein
MAAEAPPEGAGPAEAQPSPGTSLDVKNVFRAEVGSNDWQLAARIDRKEAASAMKRAGLAPPRATSFAVFDVLPAAEGLWLVGTGLERDWSWSGALIVRPDGRIEPAAVSEGQGLQVVERDPDGTLWIAGDGIYSRDGHGWRLRWRQE